MPLLTFPVLARTLSPVAWATLLIAQAVGAAVTTVMEYGHGITATRRIAANRDPAVVRRTVGLVYATKLLLALACVSVAGVVIVSGWLEERLSLSLLLGGLLLGLLQGSLPTWYFQGQERSRIAASVDMTFKILAGTAIVGAALWLRRPEPVLWTQVAGAALTWITLTTLLRREIQPSSLLPPSVGDVWKDLQQGFAAFVFRLLGSSYTSALALVLAAVVSPLASALILGADRIAKVMPTLSVPFCQALYPRIARSGAATSRQGLNRILLAAAAVFALLLLGSATLYLTRDLLVQLLLGTQYTAAADILAVALWLMPFIGWNTVLFQLWIFPSRRDRLANSLLFMNAVLSLGWITLLAERVPLPLYAAGISAAEVLLAAVLLLLALRTRSRLPNSGAAHA